MSNYQSGSNRTFKIILILTILLVLAVGIGWFWWMQKTHAPATTPLPPHSSQTVPEGESPSAGMALDSVETTQSPGPVVHYDITDDEFKKLMSERKAQFGLKDSVDMIVESGETLEVGGISLSMEEILEKIRIKSGTISESDLGPTLSTLNEKERIDRLYTQLRESEKRFEALEDELEKASPDTPDLAKKLKEHESLREVVNDYHAYRSALSAIREWELVRKRRESGGNPAEEAAVLTLQKTDLERRLTAGMEFPATDPAVEDRLLEILNESRTRLKEIDEALTEIKDLAAAPTLVRERTELVDRITALETYETVLNRIDKLETFSTMTDAEATANIDAILQDLHVTADELEDRLTDRLVPDAKTEVYGIYIVRPGDNIWNIHFQFLKENFASRGILLSPVADEPNERGVSSGVGKILKFAEGMVYIYNLRERRLSDNVNIIQPMTKIIVFNMAKAIDLIKKIERDDIKRIQFDGETLWLPAE
ncbi:MULTISPECIES: hypothetical protein [Desulfococcus]|uniref:Uncharacterized protein n=1 Tax=Desulfococcus multivorans DSM 2059 TaxID=1121405 RepID=S7VDW8_DESML|nr:hypothetical protein [Desulfococcus multivorans]AOY59115.1 conserved uncharacterized protein [Desulfococcus multivorans]AQV01351.1 hypothetical protein B2D07_11690 [Desulfococcus multivorans]EPR44924.1 hypothetical protein dsmv_0960 [Desulfococcus multivorans DSM 2059]SJZ83594.1 hypothetical protein SAMN02745446_01804 [Desulfococcus multivorans DSM 2059]